MLFVDTEGSAVLPALSLLGHSRDLSLKPQGWGELLPNSCLQALSVASGCVLLAVSPLALLLVGVLCNPSIPCRLEYGLMGLP